MTCVAGIVAPDGRVMLMSDSAASNPGGTWLQKDSKVWNHGELVLGMAGSFRGRDLLQSKLRLPNVPPDTDVEWWLRTTFVDAVRELFKENGFDTSTAKGQSYTETALLIGLRARLFVMRDDFSLGEVVSDWNAIGSGSNEANGSLMTSARFMPNEPRARLEEALNVSVTYNPGTVQPPFRFVETP